MKHLFTLTICAALSIGSVASAGNDKSLHNLDLSKRIFKIENSGDAFSGKRWQQLNAAQALMDEGKADRFMRDSKHKAKQDNDGNYTPSIVQEKQHLTGEMDNPDGGRWFFNAYITYDSKYYNEYFTEYLPTEIDVEIFDETMKSVGTLHDKLRLEENERRVRMVDVLPVATRHYFNADDKIEIAIALLNNPVNYGIVPHTYVYSLGNERDKDGNDIPIKHIDGIVSDVLNASDENGENILMTFINEGNSTGYTDSDLKDGEKYWQYQLGNWIRVQTFGAADDNGDQTLLFDKQIVYYQCQGNQQDDATVIPMILDGKPTICFPYYEKLFFKPFYSAQDDLVAEENNNLVVEIWQQNAEGQKFELTQTTKIPVVTADEPDVIWSYYGIGDFSFRNDISWNEGKASFVVTRRDYIATSDSERKTYLIYNADGSMRKMLFENAVSIAFMSDLPGFDPQTLFISHDGLDYIFNFMNMRTYEIELELNYGIKADPNDDPDYIMANIDRTLSPDGKSYMYVAEMKMPEYDDINDCTYMRIVWLNSDGSFNHYDKVNMGNKINYAQLYLSPDAVKPDFFHSDSNHEYMILIKRATEDSKSTEELLIGQVASKEFPDGRNLLLLGTCEYGALNTITPFVSENGNTLQVIYAGLDNPGKPSEYTICYYDLPLDIERPGSGIDNIDTDNNENRISLVGNILHAPGAQIEVFALDGTIVAKGASNVDLADLRKGVYIARADGKAVKIALH